MINPLSDIKAIQEGFAFVSIFVLSAAVPSVVVGYAYHDHSCLKDASSMNLSLWLQAYGIEKMLVLAIVNVAIACTAKEAHSCIACLGGLSSILDLLYTLVWTSWGIILLTGDDNDCVSEPLGIMTIISIPFGFISICYLYGYLLLSLICAQILPY